jgi:hypothetical protein
VVPRIDAQSSWGRRKELGPDGQMIRSLRKPDPEDIIMPPDAAAT